jgi:hypothetical protein
MKYLTLILVSLFLNCQAPSQSLAIGLDVSFGKSDIMRWDQSQVGLFKNGLADYYKIGTGIFFTPLNAYFSFKTGLSYNSIGNNTSNCKYLQMPAGVDVFWGHDFKAILGGGVNLNYIFSYSGFNMYPVIIRNKSKFRSGGFFNAGLGYQITSKCLFLCNYIWGMDFTRIYQIQAYSPGGNYFIDKKGHLGAISIEFRYTLK